MDNGQDLRILADSVHSVLNNLHMPIKIEGFIAVNNSSDAFYHEISALFNSHPVSCHGWTIIRSAPGKLNAQKAIVQSKLLNGYLAFVDADVLHEPNVLHLLIQQLNEDEKCMIAYAQPIPVFPKKPRLLHRFMRIHYVLREQAYQRRFFHGRTFIMRKWFWEEIHQEPDHRSKISRRLSLEVGPLVDDIALSRMAVARWGSESIKEVRRANVHFDPIDSLKGIYASALRNSFEIARLDLLYPKHAKIQKLMFSSCWKPSGLRRFSWRLRFAHFIWRNFEATVKQAASLHVHLVALGALPKLAHWIQVPGTKSFDHIPPKCLDDD